MGSRNTTILLVEDDPNDLLFMKMALEDAGVQNPLVVAADGQEALELLSAKGNPGPRKKVSFPCMVLLDLKLPHMMGLELLKWARQQSELASTIFIVLTASANAADIKAAYQLGANAYLVKPSSFDELRGLARAIRDFWIVQNQMDPACAG